MLASRSGAETDGVEDAGPTIVRPVPHDFFPFLQQLAEEAITERLVGVVRP